MMRKEDLEAILGSRDSAVKRHGHLDPVLAELYAAGCSIKQLEQMFRVSKKFIRGLPRRVDGFKFRGIGPREASKMPTADQVIGVLKRHRLRLEDLPGPKGSAAPKPRPKKRSD